MKYKNDLTRTSLSFAFRKQARGLTIIELMVAMLISLFLLGGVLQLFTGTKQTYNLQESLARIQESARFSFDLLLYELRMAGYMGCFSGVSSGNFVSTLNGSDYNYQFDTPIVLFESQADGSYLSPTGQNWANVPIDIRNLIATIDATGTFSDVVTIRRAEDDGLSLAQAMPNVSADLKFSQAPTSLEDDDIAIISDCSRSAMFQITNINTSGSFVNVVHNTGSGTPVNSTKILVSDGDPFDTDASLYSVSTSTFFVAPSTMNNETGAQVLSLYRKVNNDDPEELISGVSTLNYLAGVDTDANGIVDQYIQPNNAVMSEIINIRIDLVIQGIDPVQGNTITRSFSQTVNVRNQGLSL